MKIDAPKGAVFQTNAGKASLEWEKDFRSKWQSRYTRAQVYVDSEVLRYSEPYLPFRSGILKKSGILSTVVGSGEVEWATPYARYLYYGKVMIGQAPKQVTNRNLTFDQSKNPLAGAFWFERMKADHKNDILAGARRIAGGG